jgi:hypothetical protein
VKLTIDQLKTIALKEALRTTEEIVERPIIYLWRFEDGINCYFDGIFYHCRDDIVEDLAARLKARVGIDFD